MPLRTEFVEDKHREEIRDLLVQKSAAAPPHCRVACGTVDEESASLRRSVGGRNSLCRPITD